MHKTKPGMPHRLGRPVNDNPMLSSFLTEAGRLHAFVPPFRFSAFFSPEDTLLCACASEAALVHARSLNRARGWPRKPMHIVELTTGSGLVGLHLTMIESGSRLIGLDVDPVATDIAARNAKVLGLSRRARFECADLWSDATLDILRAAEPDLMICNPPYVPEPPGSELAIEAGAGPDGTAHLERTIEVAEKVRPHSLALSWCSLSNPAKIVEFAESAGYSLRSLFMVVIADGEYSGSVADYLRTIPHCYISERADAVEAVAPDGSCRFAYILMAGDFTSLPVARASRGETALAVERICKKFASEGLTALVDPVAPVPVRSWMLDRWDELRLRALLHGDNKAAGMSA